MIKGNHQREGTFNATFSPTPSIGTIRAILVEAGDPDSVIADWLSGVTPLGIFQEIPATGIFPRLSAIDAERLARHYAPEADCWGAFRNYVSYAFNEKKANRELARERDHGFVEFTATKAELGAKMGLCFRQGWQ